MEGWEIEADPRHAQLLIGQLGVSRKGVLTAGGPDNEAGPDKDKVDEEECTENLKSRGRHSVQGYGGQVHALGTRPSRHCVCQQI